MSETPPSDTRAPEPPASRLRTWAPLAAVCLAMFIVVVDSTMMNVAISSIVADLETTVSGVQGAIAFYSLIMASLMLLAGKLGTIFGVRRMFLIGVLIYGVGTLTAALSPNLITLVRGWSVIEGIAAALLLPLSATLLLSNYEGGRRAFAFATLAGVQASAAAVGPILGGWLTNEYSWRWGFGMQVGIVVLILPLVPLLKETAQREKADLDVWGTGLSFLALVSLVGGTIVAGQHGWWHATRPCEFGGTVIQPLGLSPVPFVLAIGVVFLVAFLWLQRRRERMGRTPLLRLGIFRNRQFVAGFATDAVQSLLNAGMLFVMPLFLQVALGYDALTTGVALLPLSLATLVVSMSSARLSNRIAPRTLIQVGIVILGLGTWMLREQIVPGVSAGDMLPGLLVFGVGTGLMMAQLTNVTLSSVPAPSAGEASGVNNTVKELGTSLGTAVIGSLLIGSVFTGLIDRVAGASQVPFSVEERRTATWQLQDAMEAMTPETEAEEIAELPPALRDDFEHVIEDAMFSGQRHTLAVLLGAVGLCFLMSLFLRTRAPKKRR